MLIGFSPHGEMVMNVKQGEHVGFAQNSMLIKRRTCIIHKRPITYGLKKTIYSLERLFTH